MYSLQNLFPIMFNFQFCPPPPPSHPSVSRGSRVVSGGLRARVGGGGLRGEETDFGQSIFGHFGTCPSMFGQSNFGQSNLGQKKIRPRRMLPRRVGPEGWEPKFSRFFFPSPATCSLFLSLSGCLLVEFWWCLKRQNPRMCTFVWSSRAVV